MNNTIFQLIEELEKLDYKCLNSYCFEVEWNKCLEIIEKIMVIDKNRAFNELLIILKSIIILDNIDEYYYAIDLLKKINMKSEELFIILKRHVYISLIDEKPRTEKFAYLLRFLKDFEKDIAIEIALENMFYDNIEIAEDDNHDPFIIDHAKNVREVCIEIFGKYKVKDSLTFLESCLNDHYEELAIKAAWALGEFNDSSLITKLIPYASGYIWLESRDGYGIEESKIVHFQLLANKIKKILSKFNLTINDYNAFTETCKYFVAKNKYGYGQILGLLYEIVNDEKKSIIKDIMEKELEKKE